MNPFETVSRIHAPSGFAACVQGAAQRAVRKTPSKLVYPLRIALITLLLLSLAAGAFALVNSLRASDLFSDASGFSLPCCQWGESASVSRPSTLVFLEHTGEIAYHFTDDRLTSADISFNRANQPEGTDMSELYRRIVEEMSESYPSVPASSAVSPQKSREMQDALREYLGADSLSESEKIYESLLEKDEALANRAREAVENANQGTSYFAHTWEDKRTNTAIQLSVSFDADGKTVRVIRISLAQLHR